MEEDHGDFHPTTYMPEVAEMCSLKHSATPGIGRLQDRLLPPRSLVFLKAFILINLHRPLFVIARQTSNGLTTWSFLFPVAPAPTLPSNQLPNRMLALGQLLLLFPFRLHGYL